MKSKMVSIIMITYGHENYIKEAIDGVLIQKCDFDIELIITNDNSPDNTDEVVRKYLLENKIPNNIIIKYTRHSINKGMMPNFLWSLEQCTGKYIALCEGDDYWIDELKLQKQVDFLENNSNYTLTVGGFISKHEYSGIKKEIIKRDLKKQKNEIGYSFTLEDSFNNWITKVLTLVFVNDKKVLNNLYGYMYSRDVHLIYHLLKEGSGFYFTEVFGTHRVHSGGIHSMTDERIRIVEAYKMYHELYKKNMDDHTRKMSLSYHCIILNFKIFNFKGLPNENFKATTLVKNIMKMIKSPTDLFFLYHIFFGLNCKSKIKTLLRKI